MGVNCTPGWALVCLLLLLVQLHVNSEAHERVAHKPISKEKHRIVFLPSVARLQPHVTVPRTTAALASVAPGGTLVFCATKRRFRQVRHIVRDLLCQVTR